MARSPSREVAGLAEAAKPGAEQRRRWGQGGDGRGGSVIGYIHGD